MICQNEDCCIKTRTLRFEISQLSITNQICASILSQFYRIRQLCIHYSFYKILKKIIVYGMFGNISYHSSQRIQEQYYKMLYNI